MKINSFVKKEMIGVILKKIAEDQIKDRFQKTLQGSEKPLSKTSREYKILSEKSWSLKRFFQEFAKNLKKEKPSLFTLSALVFRQFDHKKGHIDFYRIISVDKRS